MSCQCVSCVLVVCVMCPGVECRVGSILRQVFNLSPYLLLVCWSIGKLKIKCICDWNWFKYITVTFWLIWETFFLLPLTHYTEVTRSGRLKLSAWVVWAWPLDIHVFFVVWGLTKWSIGCACGIWRACSGSHLVAVVLIRDHRGSQQDLCPIFDVVN